MLGKVIFVCLSILGSSISLYQALYSLRLLDIRFFHTTLNDIFISYRLSRQEAMMLPLCRY